MDWHDQLTAIISGGETAADPVVVGWDDLPAVQAAVSAANEREWPHSSCFLRPQRVDGPDVVFLAEGGDDTVAFWQATIIACRPHGSLTVGEIAESAGVSPADIGRAIEETYGTDVPHIIRLPLLHDSLYPDYLLSWDTAQQIIACVR